MITVYQPRNIRSGFRESPTDQGPTLQNDEEVKSWASNEFYEATGRFATDAILDFILDMVNADNPGYDYNPWASIEAWKVTLQVRNYLEFMTQKTYDSLRVGRVAANGGSAIPGIQKQGWYYTGPNPSDGFKFVNYRPANLPGGYYAPYDDSSGGGSSGGGSAGGGSAGGGSSGGGSAGGGSSGGGSAGGGGSPFDRKPQSDSPALPSWVLPVAAGLAIGLVAVYATRRSRR